MKKVILVDGNNLLFRSYYATAYTGNIMRNSKGFPTNGLFGFVNMINKIINEDKPDYMLVAFDIGKTFRHEKYDSYKGGRDETPNELKMQFPVAKDILKAMGIKYLEVVNYEADDIIGTFARMIDDSDEYEGLIVSSDKDLLQLISDKVVVKLLKSKDYIMMDRNMFLETYGIEPSRMIDLKGLMGDASDNIPGVKGIGEKTAIKLLKDYGTIDNLYLHIDEVKGATNKKLVDGKDSAFTSREIATIYREVPVGIGFDDIVFSNNISEELVSLYKELEFYNMIKKIDVVSKSESEDVSFEVVRDINKLNISDDVALYVDIDGSNYHNSKFLGVSLYNKDISCYIDARDIVNFDFIKGNVYTYDNKKNYVVFRNNNLSIDNVVMDVMISGYLLNYNVRDDISVFANIMGYDIKSFDKNKNLLDDERRLDCVNKAKFIYDVTAKLFDDMKDNGVMDLYNNIELPLSVVLGKMEYEGIKCDSNVLDLMGKDILSRVDDISRGIYEHSGVEFNISSPKQLGEVLFDKMGLPHGKKNKSGYATDEGTLSKLVMYPIVPLVLEYRMLTKLYSTYIEGLKNSIHDDGKIHTIYTQTLTRTGRLSSIEPNLQNIPVRNEYGRLIRKSFVPSGNGVLLSSDYSQIELRIFAHLAGEEELIKAFNNGDDIHSKTASEVFGVSLDMVTSDMRRSAKAVNFGIIYGISSYGLAQDLNISPKEAKEFIDKYFMSFPKIKSYMSEVIEKAKRDGYVKTIMNRKRVIEEINNSNYMIRSTGERMALNTPIQGSSADILKMAMIEIDKRFSELNLNSKMILQVHDELVFDVCDSEIDTVKDIVRDVMENIIELDVPLVVDVNVGDNLYEAK